MASKRRLKFPLSSFNLDLLTSYKQVSRSGLLSDNAGYLLLLKKEMVPTNVRNSFELAFYHMMHDLS